MVQHQLPGKATGSQEAGLASHARFTSRCVMTSRRTLCAAATLLIDGQAELRGELGTDGSPPSARKKEHGRKKGEREIPDGVEIQLPVSGERK